MPTTNKINTAFAVLGLACSMRAVQAETAEDTVGFAYVQKDSYKKLRDNKLNNNNNGS